MGMRTQVCGQVTWRDRKSMADAQDATHRIVDYYNGDKCTIFDAFLFPEDRTGQNLRCVGSTWEFKDYENQCSQFADIVIKYAVSADIYAVDDFDRGGCLIIDQGAIVRRGCFESVEK
jgi:hypothetical protein